MTPHVRAITAPHKNWLEFPQGGAGRVPGTARPLRPHRRLSCATDLLHTEDSWICCPFGTCRGSNGNNRDKPQPPDVPECLPMTQSGHGLPRNELRKIAVDPHFADLGFLFELRLTWRVQVTQLITQSQWWNQVQCPPIRPRARLNSGSDSRRFSLNWALRHCRGSHFWSF